jgi:membrane associated rhomboid family serine protease
MFIPLGLGLKLKNFPFITFALIALNFICYEFFYTSNSNSKKIINQYYTNKVTTNLFKEYCQFKTIKKELCESYTLNINDLKEESNFDFLHTNFSKVEPLNKKAVETKKNTLDEATNNKVFKRLYSGFMIEVSKELFGDKSKILVKLKSYKTFKNSLSKLKNKLQEMYKKNNLLSKDNISFISLLKAQFSHGSSDHLWGNMLALLIFGCYVEQRLKGASYLISYFLSGTIGLSLYSSLNLSDYGSLLGASANLYGVMGMFFILFYNHYMKFLLFYVIFWKTVLMPVKFIFPLMYIAMEVVSAFTYNGVANMAHIYGLVVGIGFSLYSINQENFSWPFIYQFEFDKFKSLDNNNDIKSCISIARELLSINPINHLVREKIIYKIVSMQKHQFSNNENNQTIGNDLIYEELEHYVGKLMYNKKLNKSLKILENISLEVDFCIALKTLGQKNILRLGDFAIDKNKLFCSLRLYAIYFEVYSNKKSYNYKNLQKTCLSILDNLALNNSNIKNLEYLFTKYESIYFLKERYNQKIANINDIKAA